MKILYINACARKDSRTNMLAQHLFNKFDCEIEEIILNKENIAPLNAILLEQRDNLIAEKNLEHPMFKYAKQFASADKIVIAAPYWDLSFPAILKIYIENINVSGITFYYTENGRPQTMCKAKELIYVTTAGGTIFTEEYGFGYIKTLCETFYGINDVKLIKAENLDIIGADVQKILNKEKAEIDEICFESM